MANVNQVRKSEDHQMNKVRGENLFIHVLM